MSSREGGPSPTWAPPRAGSALIYRNPHAQPRARLMGLPAYADDERHAARLVGELGAEVRRRLVVEDPGRPLPADADASGTARIVVDEPERVVVETESAAPAYLVLADTFDPGWSATLDGLPAPIRPAFVAFRAVYVPAGRHQVVFRYRPAGFLAGLIASTVGLAVAAVLLARPRRATALGSPHDAPPCPARGPRGDWRSSRRSCSARSSASAPAAGSTSRTAGPAACIASPGAWRTIRPPVDDLDSAEDRGEHLGRVDEDEVIERRRVRDDNHSDLTSRSEAA